MIRKPQTGVSREVVHSTYPDANGNPHLTKCGVTLPNTASWRKTQAVNCPGCNSKNHGH